MPSHKDWIGTMISGLSNQYRASIVDADQESVSNLRLEKLEENQVNSSTSLLSESLGLQIYIANTETSDVDYLFYLKNLVNQANGNIFFKSDTDQNCHVRLLYDIYAPFRRVNNALYGYDGTDMMLKEMLKESHCEWILFSNGDNFYNRAWFSTVSSIALSNHDAKIIGWNFITHHLRNGQHNSVIDIKLERAHVDLGSIMIKSSAFYKDEDDRECSEDNSNKMERHIQMIASSSSSSSKGRKRKSADTDSYHRFLPQSIETEDTFARDFHLISAINKSLLFSKHVKLIDACLMFHQ